MLVDLCRLEGHTRHGPLIAAQLMDVAVRVAAVRGFAVGQMALLIDNAHAILGMPQPNHSIAEVLLAGAWICGEFASLLANPQATLAAMLRPRVLAMPGHVTAAFVHNAAKLWIHVIRRAEDEDDAESIGEVCGLMEDRLPDFVSSGDLEVQERASSVLMLVKTVAELRRGSLVQEEADVTKVGEMLSLLVAGELNPVAPKAQKKVPLPEGLDLDAWINDPPSEPDDDGDDEDDDELTDIFVSPQQQQQAKGRRREQEEPTEEELEKRRAARRQEQASNPYYVKSASKSKRRSNHVDVDHVPVEAIELDVPLQIPGLSSFDKYEHVGSGGGKRAGKRGGKRGKKGKHSKRRESTSSEEEVNIISKYLDSMPIILAFTTCLGEIIHHLISSTPRSPPWWWWAAARCPRASTTRRTATTAGTRGPTTTRTARSTSTWTGRSTRTR